MNGAQRGARRRDCSRGRQRGAVALAVVVMLYAAAALAVMFVHRSLVFEQRAAANQVRTAIAHEAAEAGLDWATVRLRSPSPITADCLPTTDGKRFSELHFVQTPEGGTLLPVSPGRAVGACVAPLDGSAWRCQCALADAPLQVPAGTGAGFSVEFEGRAGSRVVDVVSHGCTRATLGPSCTGDAQARLRVTLAVRPALAASPGAALTVRGDVAVGDAPMGVHNPDAASGGVALRAGGDVDAAALRAAGPAGSLPSDAVAAHDAALAAVEPQRLFQALFGLPRDTWRESFADEVLSCPCGAEALRAAADRGARKLWLRGDLTVDTPIALGTDMAPVVVVVDGGVRLHGAVRMWGLLYASDISWHAGRAGAVTSARIDGAVVSEAHFRGDAAPDLVYDPQVIARLQALHGTFVRVPGSWRDDTPAP